jgi:DNA-directed RNA polymerase specialized sigma24 family protein
MVPPPEKKSSQLSKESFDALLSRLDPDRERAGEIYEKLRRELADYLRRHDCADPEFLAAKTLDRAGTRIREGAVIVSEVKYCYGIARNVLHEYFRSLERRYDPPLYRDPAEVETETECMRQCAQLHFESYELIAEYLSLTEETKLEMAERLGLTIHGLRTRVHRARKDLQKCLRKCRERVEPQN